MTITPILRKLFHLTFQTLLLVTLKYSKCIKKKQHKLNIVSHLLIPFCPSFKIFKKCSTSLYHSFLKAKPTRTDLELLCKLQHVESIVGILSFTDSNGGIYQQQSVFSLLKDVTKVSLWTPHLFRIFCFGFAIS